MFGLDVALAFLLLTAPAEKVEIKNPAAMHKALAPAVAALAMQWEILDPRETDYLRNPPDFASDLKLLQKRFEELKDAPALDEVERFPPRQLVSDMLAFNLMYRDNVKNRLEMDMIHAEDMDLVLKEAEQLNRIYESVRDARCDYYYVTYRRQALAQLRKQIGGEAFYTGQLPPHVPLWRIPEAH